MVFLDEWAPKVRLDAVELVPDVEEVKLAALDKWTLPERVVEIDVVELDPWTWVLNVEDELVNGNGADKLDDKEAEAI